MDIKIRQYAEEDVKETIAIWNEVVKEGIAFPQKETLTESTGDLFLKSRHLRGSLMTKRKKKLSECTFCIRIISEDAVTYVMQVMLSEKICGDFISGKCL